MVEIIEARKEHLLPLIKLAFANDSSLHKYHAEPGTFEQMCGSNYNRILTYEEQPGEMKFFKVEINDQVIGYTVTYKHEGNTLLVSFGINVLFRRDFILTEWLLKIAEMFGPVYVPLYEKNERAVRFFERHKFEVFNRIENVVILWQ